MTFLLLLIEIWSFYNSNFLFYTTSIHVNRAEIKFLINAYTHRAHAVNWLISKDYPILHKAGLFSNLLEYMFSHYRTRIDSILEEIADGRERAEGK